MITEAALYQFQTHKGLEAFPVRVLAVRGYYDADNQVDFTLFFRRLGAAIEPGAGDEPLRSLFVDPTEADALLGRPVFPVQNRRLHLGHDRPGNRRNTHNRRLCPGQTAAKRHRKSRNSKRATHKRIAPIGP